MPSASLHLKMSTPHGHGSHAQRRVRLCCPFTELTDADFAATENYSEEATCRYLEARLAHQAGDVAARDAAAQRYEDVRMRELRATGGQDEDPCVAPLRTLVTELGRRVCNTRVEAERTPPRGASTAPARRRPRSTFAGAP